MVTRLIATAAIGYMRLVFFVIFFTALVVRLSFLEANPYPTSAAVLEGEMAHNIVDHGRWFAINERASYQAASLQRRMRRIIDPGQDNFKLLDRNPLWRPEIIQPVGGAVVLAGLWQITAGERYLPLQVLQAVVDALVALLVYWVALRLFDRRAAAILAAALYALCLPVAQNTTVPYVDIWAVDFTIAIVAIYLEVIGSPHRWRWLILCGLTTGIGIYFRPNLVILPVLLALSTLAWAGWRETLRRALTITVVAGILLVPWTIRNFNDFNAFIPTTSGVGQTLWEGLGELPNDFGAVWNPRLTSAEVHRVHPSVLIETPAYDNILGRWGLRAIVHHPLFYLRVLAFRAADVVWLYAPEWMSSGAITPFAYKPGPLAFVVDHPFNLAEDAFQPLLVILAALGLLLTWRRRRQSHAILIATTFAVLVPYILLLVEPRYVLPAEFVYCIWAGLGIEALARRVIERFGERDVSAPIVLADDPGWPAVR